jgi:signal transduction histidine kinase
MGVMAWLRPRLVACGQELVAGVLSFAGGIPLLVLSILSVAFVPLFGAGIFLVPAVTFAVRALANERRRLASEWAGVPIPVPYRPEPDRPPGSLVDWWRRTKALKADPATWRDELWLLCAPVSLALGILPAGIVVYGLEGIFAVPIVTAFAGPGYGYTFGWAVDFPGESLVAIPQGVLLVWFGLAIAPRMQRVSAGFARWTLGPVRSAELTQRVQRLTETRAEALDAQAAELRRIERDLHDGTQARLAAVGLSIGMAAEEIAASKPDVALRWLAEARESSDRALADLRDLVRGIHPPLLAEQGLTEAVRGLAMGLPIPVDVDIDLPGRLAAAVESAAYFAVAETLTNVAKHSRAKAAWIMMRHSEDRLMMMVADDGVGAADPGKGTGLAGVSRRLAAFDGMVDVASPPGGPTVVTMELLCESSLPKTTPSSGTG